ncbi:MAG: biotin-dependent carboxyltransferase family protein [Acidobacteria bacterium]|nr:biotin-dependent carboxyltransferase family protein [Acidobacteriota bacterium]
MSILIRKPGIRTAVRDFGRFGHMAAGINPTGAMDTLSARVVNILLGNSDNAALLEFGFPAPEIEFEADTAFCIGGSAVDAKLNSVPVSLWKPQKASPRDILTLSPASNGNFAYLAVAGGFDVPEVLGSRTTNLAAGFGGHQGQLLAPGDRLSLRSPGQSFPNAQTALGYSLRPQLADPIRIRITRGPEYDRITALSEQTLTTETFSVGQNSDPMGFRLTGPRMFSLDETELLSSAATFGTVQLLPDGGLAVLMSDHQTTGGYPRIAVVAAVDLPLLSQLRPKRPFQFVLIDVSEAEMLLFEREQELRFLKTGLRLARG